MEPNRWLSNQVNQLKSWCEGIVWRTILSVTTTMGLVQRLRRTHYLALKLSKSKLRALWWETPTWSKATKYKRGNLLVEPICNQLSTSKNLSNTALLAYLLTFPSRKSPSIKKTWATIRGNLMWLRGRDLFELMRVTIQVATHLKHNKANHSSKLFSNKTD